MQFEKFKDQFHDSWWSKIKPFIESKECDKIYEYLKFEGKRGVRIVPDSSNTFRAFKETPLNEIKAVLLGYCPYHTISKDGIPAADGLAMSCSLTGKLQPSLELFYQGIEDDLYSGLNLNYEKNPDLTYLAKDGVLLLNSSLTTEFMKPGKHQSIWEPFTKYVIEECLAYTGIPIVLIGKDAQYYERYMTPLTHGVIFKVEHMAFAARENRAWDHKNIFSKINTILRQNNGKEFEVDWLNEKPPF